MRCFYVLVHGKINWNAELPEIGDPEIARPAGFYCHRFVLAANEREAAEIAFHRVRASLDKESDWLAKGLATIDLEAEETAAAPMHNLLRKENRGHSFYEED
jgi:hypothetical protein